MSINRHQPHVVVIPEDKANRQLVEGFLKDPMVLSRKVQVVERKGGWKKTLESFKVDEVVDLDRYAQRFVVLLIDFDKRDDRLEYARKYIPEHLVNRVFILGVLTEPEALKTALGHRTLEDIGRTLAKDCREETYTIWGHELLLHNKNELDRLRRHVRDIVF